MSAILIDREIVHYEALGRGRPLIFIHGWVGSWRYWIPVMQAVSVQYRAYGVDLWGFGDTAKFTSGYALEEQVTLVERFMYEMGLMRVALVGHGLGAVVSLLYALRNPESVDRLFVVGYPFESKLIHSRLRNSPPQSLADWLLDRSSLSESVRSDVPKTDAQAIAASLSSIEHLALLEQMQSLTIPSVWVHGQNDPAIPAPGQDVLATLPETAHAVLFEESGHFPMLEESSKFNRMLMDFLDLPSGASPRQLQVKEEWKRRVR
ncbi:MAG: alpha/beta hydrolase [Chloroflexi bacterium]|jgi:pimeloyl-ACP methyl ester carboxylesterase|nr:alpha/beta hydrolase [Anaerolineaceae bacterium]NMB88114.1 alpha/beta hydrolase [Chloroflexota bacterium]